jgi:lipoprotein-anchoring transpeptidase ErfK/SrfK
MRVGKLAKNGEISSVSIHKQPSEDSLILYQRYKDELINVYGEIESEDGPEYNPFWYRVWGGFVHRAYLQEVKSIVNPVVNSINEGRQLGEITVPYTTAFRYSSISGWERIYRLYYETTHWIVDIITGPDGQPWYEIEDELDRLSYAVPAENVRILDDSEFDPISPDVPPGEKRIEISISQQELTAFEGDQVVMKTNIASGALTPEKQTPAGEFRIQSTYPSKHMGGTKRDDIYAYVLPGVPWSCFFEKGIATHGTYWHNNYGIPQSSGCINMRNHEAKWLFRWVNPVGGPHEIYRTGSGTRVAVI